MWIWPLDYPSRVHCSDGGHTTTRHGKGIVEKWFDDILLHNKTLRKHLALIREVLHLLAEAGYSVRFVRVLLVRGRVCWSHGGEARSATSTVEGKGVAGDRIASHGEVRAFLGIAGFLRGYVADFSTLVAPVLYLCLDRVLSSCRARNKLVP